MKDAASSPAILWRSGLRAGAEVPGDPEDAEPVRVLRVDPRDGAMGVFRDSPVIVRLSQPVDQASLTADAFHVEGPEGRVAGRLALSPDGCCLIWTAERLLAPDELHFVVVRGLADRHGRGVEPHITRFVPCDLVWTALFT